MMNKGIIVRFVVIMCGLSRGVIRGRNIKLVIAVVQPSLNG